MTRNQRKIREISRYLWEHYRWPLQEIYLEYGPRGETILSLCDNDGDMYPIDIYEDRAEAQEEKRALEAWLRDTWSDISSKD